MPTFQVIVFNSQNQDENVGTITWAPDSATWVFNVNDEKVEHSLTQVQKQGWAPLRVSEVEGNSIYDLIRKVTPDDEDFIDALRDKLSVEARLIALQ